jgi:hypothetical protein
LAEILHDTCSTDMHVVHGFFLTDESFRAFEKHALAIYSIRGNVPHVIQEARSIDAIRLGERENPQTTAADFRRGRRK